VVQHGEQWQKGESEQALVESLWTARPILPGVVGLMILTSFLDQHLFSSADLLNVGVLVTAGTDGLHSLIGAAPKERSDNRRHPNSGAFI
jgi:hypothetical protein